MKGIFKKIIAGSLAVACTVTAGVAAIATNGFGLFGNTAQVEKVDHNDQLFFGNFFGNGIMLTASADTFENSDLTEYDTTAYAGYNWLGGHTLNAVDGKISVNSSRIILVDYITISELESVEIGDGYALTWLAYDENHTYLGNGSNTYPTLPAEGVWMASGEDLQASTITDWNANAKYMRFVIMAYYDSDVATFLTISGVKINTNSTPSTPSADGYRLTATVTDETGARPEAYQSVTWSMTWANTNSGKVTDYVNMTTNGCIADFECVKGFNTQIIVTCASTIDPSIKATATLDYYKRIETISMSAGGTTHAVANGGVVNVQLESAAHGLTSMEWLSYSLNFCSGANFSSVGTLDNSLRGMSVSVEYTDAFKQKLQNNFNYNWTFTTIGYGGTDFNKTYNQSDFLNGLAGAGTVITNYSVDLFELYNESTNEVKVTLSSLATTYGSGTTITYYIDLSAEAIAVASVSLAEGSSFIF